MLSTELDKILRDSGTRFRVFAQPPYATSAFSEAEEVYVRPAPSQISAGPADDRMYVLDPICKPVYQAHRHRPFLGQVRHGARPRRGEHSEGLAPSERDFLCATFYAGARRVLDIWEDYFGRRIDWHFRLDFDRLELIPLADWDDAQWGYGFLEFGYERSVLAGIDRTRPHCQNFEMVAHAMGRLILEAELPGPDGTDGAALRESGADLISLLALLHFDGVVDHILRKSSGNLFTPNQMTRIGELRESPLFRRALSYERVSSTEARYTRRSLPFTGACVDVTIEIFRRELVRAGIVHPALAVKAWRAADPGTNDAQVQAGFDAAFAERPGCFRDAFLRARDSVGRLLACAWQRAASEPLTARSLGQALLSAARAVGEEAHEDAIRDSLQRREIAQVGAFPPVRLCSSGLFEREDHAAPLYARPDRSPGHAAPPQRRG